MGCPGCLKVINMQRPPSKSPLKIYLASWVMPPSVKDDADHEAAKNWAKGYSPAGREENGEVLLDFAQSQYELLTGMVTDLDKKSDDLMKIILTIFAAVLTLASTKIIQVSGIPALVAIAGLFFLALSVVLATLLRMPAPLEIPMAPKDLMEVSDLPKILPSKSQVQSAAAASYHVAVIGAMIINEWKTTQLQRANRFFLMGLLVLAFSLLCNRWTSGPVRTGLDLKFELKTSSHPPSAPTLRASATHSRSMNGFRWERTI